MSRWAAGITASFLAVLWPAVIVFARVWDCPGGCRDEHGRTIVVAGITALILAPVAALTFMLARCVHARVPAIAIMVAAVAVLAGSMLLGAWAAGGLLDDATGFASVGNSFVVAVVMAVYCAAVAGGSWMSAVGVCRLEADE
jgi:hypothetical protein